MAYFHPAGIQDVIMRPLTIFRHIACEGPAYLAEVLDRHAIPWRLVRIDEDEPVPDSLADSSGLVFMGGPMSVNDPLPWIEQELALIHRAQAENMPVLGHCLGGQLICKALGGTISANPVKEIGWHSVRKCNTPAAEKWLADLPDETTLFHWHGETFSIPDGAEVILESEHCPHQAFAIGNTLALQCHVEMMPPMVTEWAALYAHELQETSTTVQSAEQMTTNLSARILEAQQIADIIYERWLSPLLAERT
jgi:GMP synthase-like glutamine amidotransferase